jgi:hypothetical protein
VLFEAEVGPALMDPGDVGPERVRALHALVRRQIVEHDVGADDGHDRVHIVLEPADPVALDKSFDVVVNHRRHGLCLSARRGEAELRDQVLADSSERSIPTVR